MNPQSGTTALTPAAPAWLGSVREQARAARAAEAIVPNALVRWAFCLSIFAIPFMRVYLPGTGDRVGVARLVQLLLIVAVFSQWRVCLRWLPMALVWVAGYTGFRLLMGVWLSPEYSRIWWPNNLEWIQYSLPWTWILFNVIQFPKLARAGLWAMVWGCTLCALFHIAGIGVAAVDNSLDVRTTVFGENANVVGATYAIAVTALIGLNMFKEQKASRRWLVFLLIGIVGVGLAKTGSRTAMIMVAIGVAVLLLQARSFSSRWQRYSTLLLIALVFAGVISQVPTVMKRFQVVGSGNLERQEGRVRMIPVLWEIFLRSPVYGNGPDLYQPELTRRAMPHLIAQQRTIASHNLVLLLLVETGVIGLLLFATGLGKAVVAAWRARVNDCGLLPLALLLPLVISGMVLSNPTHDQAFWFAFAYALAGKA